MKNGKLMLGVEIAFSVLAFVGTLGSTILGWKKGRNEQPQIQDKTKQK